MKAASCLILSEEKTSQLRHKFCKLLKKVATFIFAVVVSSLMNSVDSYNAFMILFLVFFLLGPYNLSFYISNLKLYFYDVFSPTKLAPVISFYA
jgi:hypothetical protein